MTAYTVLTPHTDVLAQIERRKSRFLTVLRRADTAEDAQEFLDRLRKEHHSARHHCSAWMIGHDRRVQRANDDGEPSGTAGAPMLEALAKAQMPNGAQNLSDIAVVVIRWFGGTLLGAGGLVSAYSDSVIAVLEQALEEGVFRTRQRMRRFALPAPITEAGRWEHELRSSGVTLLGTDYGFQPGRAVLFPAVRDSPEITDALYARVATLSSGTAELAESGVDWVDL